MQKQVFQTHSATRWNSFKWFIRIFSVVLLLGLVSVLISLLNKRNYNLEVLTYKAKQLPDVNAGDSKTFVSTSEEQAFANHLHQIRTKHKRNFYQPGRVLPQSVKKYLPVRAAFYVNWDPQSFSSLQKNISHLNMVLPEWIFQAGSTGKTTIGIDNRVLNLLRKNKVSILPMLTNNFNDRWNGDSTLALLSNKEARGLLICNIKSILDSNHFQGINIDLESLPGATYPFLMEFSKELYAVLHPSGYLTTIDVNPFDRQMAFKELAAFYDFIFLMAYDEHYPESGPGCISSMLFVEKALDHALKEMPSEKSVLCVGGYGYDWPAQGEGVDISYHDLISLANGYGATVKFNEEDLDLSLQYTDDLGIRHEAHANDAAGIFNLLRTSADYGTAGVALWYLGAEDSRIWTFYSRNLNADSLERHPFNIKQLEPLHSMYSVDYEGKGEILQILSEPRPGKAKIEFDARDKIITNEKYLSLPASYIVKRYGAVDHKQVALTFDDGPDADYTPRILDILKEKHIPATFFVTGINSENNLPLIRRIYREGNEIGNHTFTHPNLENISKERERMELRSTRLLIESVIGHSTVLFRPPYNTDAEPRNMFQIEPVAIAGEEGFICVAASIDPNDWEEGVTADTILARAREQDGLGNIILLHDAGGERSQTVKALPYIIDYYKNHGYRFTTVSTLMGKTRDQVMPAVSGRQRLPGSLDLIPFIFTFLWENFLHGFFVIAILLTVLKLVALAVLSFLQQRRERKKAGSTDACHPKVSIVVPAYNEQLNAVNTINALLQSDYPDFEILFVDDGSTDHTLFNVRSAFEGNPRVRVLTKPNGGKADALNLGTMEASGEILVCIDADTILSKDAVSKMIPFFMDPDVAGVAGNVRVGNSLNLLTRAQSLEYTTSQNFDRRAFDYVNAVIVIPGAIGAFRKKAVETVGGFATDTLAEDCDLTLRLLREGYVIRNGNEALAFTEAPETLRMFLKQRFRWSFGMMQSFWKHRDLLFSLRKTNLGWILLPNLLVFNFIIPLFSPWVDIMFLAGLFTRHATEYLFIYFIYYFVDCGVSAMAYRYDHSTFSLRKALLLFVQRFLYRQLMFYVLFKAYLKAIRGELESWGVLKRTGNARSNDQNID